MKRKIIHPEDPTGTADKNKRLLIFVLKVLVTVSLFLILFSYIGFQEILNKINKLGIGTAIWILFLLTIQQFASALRWGFILNKIGERIDARKVIQIFMAGAIANSVLITSLAGLSVRVLLLSKSGTSVKRAIYSLAVEKFFSSGTLLICFVAGMAFLSNIDSSTPPESFRFAMLIVIAALVLTGLGLVLLARFQFSKASELLEMIRNSITNPAAFAMVLLLSIFIVTLGFLSVATIAVGLGVEISLAPLIAILPGIAIMSALPLSLGGWGVREVSMVVGFGVLGVDGGDALATSLTYGLLSVFATFIAAGASLLIRVPSGEDLVQ
jgi:uncharacterized membrane protein YbhN (UPF0104 family)